MKTCTKCNIEKKLSSFVKDARRSKGVATYCKSCSYELQKDWRKRNPEKFKVSNDRYANKNPGRHYRTKFGITNDDKISMLQNQDMKCAACGSTEHNHPRLTNNSGWIVDHNHATGKIRGILCWPCNVTLGHSKESINRLFGLIEYMKKNAAVNTLLSGMGCAANQELRHVA